MIYLQFVTLFVVIGLSSQSFLRFNAISRYDESVCPDSGPVVSAKCDAYGEAHKDALGDCAEKIATDLMTKIQGQTDKDVINKEVCAAVTEELTCADLLKDGCTAEDIEHVKTYEDGCLKMVYEQLLKVKLSC